jgi:hypothetical protein
LSSIWQKKFLKKIVSDIRLVKLNWHSQLK